MAVTGDALPVTALASDPGVPVVMFDGNAALRMAVVDRRSISGLDESWDTSGVYLLLDPVALDGAYGVYVGKAPAGLRSRVRQHARGKEHWSRSLLVTRDTTHGWHSAQVGWLEGRLYDLLDGASLATLLNGNRPQDESLPAYDRSALEAAVTPIAAVLRLLGCSPDAFDEDAPSESPGRSPRQYNVTVSGLVEAGELAVGEKLRSTSLSAPGVAVVREDGTVTVDGQRSAGSHVRGGKATNGWSFWAVERTGRPCRWRRYGPTTCGGRRLRRGMADGAGA